MSAVTETTLKIDLPVESAILLGRIANHSGESRETVATRAIELWLDRYRIHGPAFSRIPGSRARKKTVPVSSAS
jgi:hypothetical protein